MGIRDWFRNKPEARPLKVTMRVGRSGRCSRTVLEPTVEPLLDGVADTWVVERRAGDTGAFHRVARWLSVEGIRAVRED